MSAKFPRGGGSKPILSHPSIVANFSVSNVSFNAIRETKIIAKIFDLQFLLLLMRWNDAIFTFENIELYHGHVDDVYFAYFYYTDIYIELLRGYHNLDTGLNIQHKGSGKLTIRAYNGHEVHVV